MIISLKFPISKMFFVITDKRLKLKIEHVKIYKNAVRLVLKKKKKKKHF